MFKPEKKFASSYRLKAHRLDENDVSVIKLRKTIVMVYEKSRAGVEKNSTPNMLKKQDKNCGEKKTFLKGALSNPDHPVMGIFQLTKLDCLQLVKKALGDGTSLPFIDGNRLSFVREFTKR